MLGERGVKPDQLPSGEDVKKLQRKLEGDEKKIVKDAKVLKKGK
jgi:DNA-damage-inducible protein D